MADIPDTPTWHRKPLRVATLILITWAIMFLAAELVARSVVALQTGSLLAYAVGFDRDVAVELRSFRSFEFLVSDRSVADDVAGNSPATIPPSFAKGSPLVIRAVAVGGSTTAGFSCSSSASAWPQELEARLRGWSIENRGVSGTHADEAVRQVLEALSSSPPDVVFWASFVNNIRTRHVGPQRNFHRLVDDFPVLMNTHYLGALGRAGTVAASIIKTGGEVSVAFLIVAEGVERLVSRIIPKGRYHHRTRLPLTWDEARKLEEADHRLSIDDALAQARAAGARTILVRPPITFLTDDEIPGSSRGDIKRWNAEHGRFMERTAREEGLRYIDLQAHPPFDRLDSTTSSKLFCDMVHLTRAGHEAAAAILAAELTRTGNAKSVSARSTLGLQAVMPAQTQGN